MADLAALTWILPGYRIQTDVMAELLGAPNNRLMMFVPPAGWTSPVVEPAPALAFGLAETGWQPDEARLISLSVEKKLLASLPTRLRPVMIDENTRVRQMVSVAAVAGALAAFGDSERLMGRTLLRCADHVGAACVFDMDASWVRPRRLRDYLNGPPPDAWTEVWFSLGGQLATDALEEQARRAGRSAWDMCSGTQWERENPITEAWLREIMPIAADIAAAIGSPVLDRPGDVAGNGYDYHGDVHRWLMLDFVCWFMPRSPFVAYLVEVTGAGSVAALRAALQSPASYAADFKLVDAMLHLSDVDTLSLFASGYRQR